MGPERLAVYTTVYPGVEQFLPAWFNSVRAQTDPDFDLWIGLDGLSPAQLAPWLVPGARVRWFPGRRGATPGAIRAGAIAQMVRRYDAVVFVDSDDVLCASRVAAAREALGSYDVVGCGLAMVDERLRALPYQVRPPNGTDAATHIAEANVFGLSNTAYRTAALEACLPIADACVLVDWFLVTRAWLGEMRIGFDPEPRMHYRQHGANIARMLGPFTDEQVRRGAALVAEHYRLVRAEPCPAGPRRDAVIAAQARVEAFQRAIAASPAVLERYLEAINRRPAGWAWWWWIATPELEDVWSD